MISSTAPAHLTNDVHVIISTLSGAQKASSYYEDTLLPYLISNSIQHSKHVTESAETINHLTRSLFLPQARQGVKQTIILLSGDGGVVDLVNELAVPQPSRGQNDGKTQTYVPPTLAIIPLGTANALAHSSGVAQDAIGVLQHGNIKPLPIFTVTLSAGAKVVTDEGRGREIISTCDDQGNAVLHGAVVFSWGLHASLVALSDTTEMRKHGIDRFKMAAGTLLQEGHEYQGEIKILPREELEIGSTSWRELNYEGTPSISSTSHSYVLATLVSNLEETFTVSPASKPLDGHMWLVAIPAIPPSDIMRVLGLAYQKGEHVGDPQVKYEDIVGIRLEMKEAKEKWRIVCIDGKIVALEDCGWVEVRLHGNDGIEPLVNLLC